MVVVVVVVAEGVGGREDELGNPGCPGMSHRPGEAVLDDG